MKQAFLKFSGKKLIVAAFLSASVLVSSVNAAPVHHSIEIVSNEDTQVEFTGSTSDALLFKVNIKNEKADYFTVTIKNTNGDILFSKSFNEVNFQKRFKVLKGDQVSDTYYFTITSNNKSLVDSYAISATSRTIDDVVINKL